MDWIGRRLGLATPGATVSPAPTAAPGTTTTAPSTPPGHHTATPTKPTSPSPSHHHLSSVSQNSVLSPGIYSPSSLPLQLQSNSTNPKEAFRLLTSQFNQNCRTDESRMLALIPTLTKMIDMIDETHFREIIDISGYASEIRNMIPLIAKALRNRYRCDTDTVPSLEDINMAADNCSSIYVCLRALELFLSRDNDAILTASIDSGITEIAPQLMYLLIHVTASALTGIITPHTRTDLIQQELQHLPKSIGNMLRVLCRRERSAKLIDYGLLMRCLMYHVVLCGDHDKMHGWMKCASRAVISFARSDMFDLDLCTTMKSTGVFDTMLSQVRVSITSTHLYHAATVFTTFTDVIKEAARLAPVIMDELDTLGVYDIAAMLIIMCSVKDCGDVEVSVLRGLESLAYTGSMDIEESLAGFAEAPLQQARFRLPVAGTGPRVRSAAATSAHRDVYVASERLLSQLPITPTPAQLARARLSATNAFFDIIKENPINYFLLSQSDTMIRFVEGLGTVDASTRTVVLDILRYVLVTLGYVPIKELSLTFLHFHGTSSHDITIPICDFCVSVLKSSHGLRQLFRDIGVLDMLSGLIGELARRMQPITLSTSTLTKAKTHSEWTNLVIDSDLQQSFPSIMHVLAELLEDGPIRAAFVANPANDVFTLISSDQFRPGALHVANLLLNKHLPKKLESPTPSTGIPELRAFFKAFQNSHAYGLDACFAMLSLCKESIHGSFAMQTAYRSNGGIATLVHVLGQITGADPTRLVERKDTVVEESVADTAQVVATARENDVKRDGILVLWFETVICVLVDCPANRHDLAREMDAALSEESMRSCCIWSESSARLAIGGLFAVAFEDTSLIQFFTTKLALDAAYSEIQHVMRDAFSSGRPVPLLKNPRCLLASARLLTDVSQSDRTLVLAVLEAFNVIALSNKHNQVHLSSSGILRVLLTYLFDRSQCWFLKAMTTESTLSTLERTLDESDPALFKRRCGSLVESTTKRLIEVGILDTELQYLLSRINVHGQVHGRTKSDKSVANGANTPDNPIVMVLNILLHGLRHGHSPFYFHFDGRATPRHGHMVIPDYGRSFPPAGGYTFLAWIRVEKFSASGIIPIMIILDNQDKVRMCISIEAGNSRRLVLETVKSTQRFDSFLFHERQWVHIALVHQKPRLTASTIELYVNGVRVESAKCGYLGHPGSIPKVQTLIGYHPSISVDGNDPETISSTWDLGPTYFIEEILLDASAIETIHDMRFETTSNWQGYLQKYQSLEKRPKKQTAHLEETTTPLSTISFVLGQTPKIVSDTLGISEDKILFALCANNALEKVVEQRMYELNSTLATMAAKVQSSVKGVFNSAFPKPPLATDTTPELAIVRGDILVVCPQRVIDGVWKLGGCALLLKLIEMSTNSETLYQSVSVLVESLGKSWRNAAEMDKFHFFEILSHLLKKKRDSITIAVMDVLLVLVGRTLENSDDPTLTNAQALRHLFLDIELWRTTPELQRYYQTQLNDFVVHSSNRDLNVQRLNKMAMIKRFLLMLKAQIIPHELLPDFMTHLRIFLKAGWSNETVKSVCTYLIYTLPKENDYSEVRGAAGMSKPGEVSGNLDDVPSLVMDVRATQGRTYTVQVRNALLTMLNDILGERTERGGYVSDFVRIVSVRWVVLFCGPRIDNYTVVIATRLFVRIWSVLDGSYPSKFKEGCLILSRLLQPYSAIMALYPPVLSILCGADVDSATENMEYSVAKLMAVMKFETARERKFASPDAMRILSSLLTQSIRLVTAWSDAMDNVNQVAVRNPDSATTSPSQPDGMLSDETRLGEMSRKIAEDSRDGQSPQALSPMSQFMSRLEAAQIRLSSISEMAATTLQFLAIMYLHYDDIKEILCRQESVDEIVGLLYHLISTETSQSALEKELAAKGEYADVDEITSESIFHADSLNEANASKDKADFGLKLRLELLSMESNVSSPIRKPMTTGIRGESVFSLVRHGHTRDFSGQSAAAPGTPAAGGNEIRGGANPTVVFGISNTGSITISPVTRTIIDALIELVITISVESILGTWRPLQGIDAILKATPASSRQTQSQFQSFILMCTMNALHAKLYKRKTYLSDSRLVHSLGKFITILVDKAYQNALPDGFEIVYDFVLSIADLLQSLEDEIALGKGARVDSNAFATILRQLNRITLYFFGVCASTQYSNTALLTRLLDRILFYQKIIFSPKNSETEAFRSMVHHMYVCLIMTDDGIKRQTTAIWKLLLLQKPAQISALLRSPRSAADYKDLVDGFSHILEMDPKPFINWLPTRQDEVTAVFQENATRYWEQLCQSEARSARDSLRSSNKARYSKLKKQYKRAALDSGVFVKYLAKAKAWILDVQKSEVDRYQRFRSDYAIMVASIEAEWAVLSNSLLRERAIWGPDEVANVRWKLDFTEASARMRKRMRRNMDTVVHYQNKSEKIMMSSKMGKASNVDIQIKEKSSMDGNLSNNAENDDTAPKTDPKDIHEHQVPDVPEKSGLNQDTGSHISSNRSSHREYRNNKLLVGVLNINDDDAPVLSVDDSPRFIFSPTGDDEGGKSAKDMDGVPDASDAIDENFGMIGMHPAPQVELSTENMFGDKQDTDVEPESDWEEVILDEDQNRKLLRLIEPGDEIIDTVNCARILGLELCEGLCILCQDSVYLVDNYLQSSDGEIQDVDDVPAADRNIYHSIVSSTKRQKSSDQTGETVAEEERHACRRCTYSDIDEVHKRLYLFRSVALEIFLADGRNFLLSFWSTRARDAVYNRLQSKASLGTGESVSGINPASGQGVLGSVIFGGSPLAELTQKWCSREISNFAYLMHLNTLAGRSYNDLTQYPVFPWVISDYESNELDLTDERVYRDFSKPMGAQSPTRASEFAERFKSWDDTSIPGCHYGTHYSSSMIVCSYLLRLEPFTQQYLKLQGGHFDHPDRLFHSIAVSWQSASKLNTTDVRELIPEFYYLPEFLVNHNRFEFGTKQTGEVIDNVVLPPWAKEDPRLFVRINREALESEYASAHLHEWIDLIFGHKQRGEEAARATNVFHYLSYEGAVDIDKIEDIVEKQATIGIIHNFGQTPRQLFKRPHPRRSTENFEDYYRIHKTPEMIIEAATPLRVIPNQPISDIVISPGLDRVYAVASSKLFVPPNFQRYIEWDYLDNSLRLCNADNSKIICVFENLHIGHVTCAAFTDATHLVTGGSDMCVCFWEFSNARQMDFNLIACMRGHRKKVISLAVSSSYSIAVSGGEDGIAIIWDLSRRQYVRSIAVHDGPVTAVAIHNDTGDILTCDGIVLCLWSVNGDLLITRPICSIGNTAKCITFAEGRPSEVPGTSIILTGHQRGCIKVWKLKIRNAQDAESPTVDSSVLANFIDLAMPGSKTKWYLHCAKTLEPHTTAGAVTTIRSHSSGRVLVTGDVAGRVTAWMLPDGSGTELHYSHDDACMSCNSKFGVLERKVNCKCCGGAFCGQCIGVANANRGNTLCSACGSRIRAFSAASANTNTSVPLTPALRNPRTFMT